MLQKNLNNQMFFKQRGYEQTATKTCSVASMMFILITLRIYKKGWSIRFDYDTSANLLPNAYARSKSFGNTS